jgi:hypothetical protein
VQVLLVVDFIKPRMGQPSLPIPNYQNQAKSSLTHKLNKLGEMLMKFKLEMQVLQLVCIDLA